MYKVLDRNPTVCDAHVRWHIGYANKCGRDNNVTSKKYMKLRDRCVFPGVTITHERNRIRSVTSVGEGDRLLTYFTNSLKKIRLCGNEGNTHWVGIRDKLPAHLQYCAPCSSEEEDGGAQLGDDDNATDIRGVGCPKKSEVIPNVAGVTQDNEQKGASSYIVPSQLSPGSDGGGYCGRRRVHQQSECAYFDFMPVYESVTHMATGKDEGAKQCAKNREEIFARLQESVYGSGREGLASDGSCVTPANFQ